MASRQCDACLHKLLLGLVQGEVDFIILLNTLTRVCWSFYTVFRDHWKGPLLQAQNTESAENTRTHSERSGLLRTECGLELKSQAQVLINQVNYPHRTLASLSRTRR